ncbi:MAG: hypothetical protein ACJ79W_26110 [Myxococcales bacterium]
MSKSALSVLATFLVCAGAHSSRAGEDGQVRPVSALEFGVLGGFEPVHGDLPENAAALLGADLRIRIAVVSLGVRYERTAGFSGPGGVEGFTRVLGTLGFNIGLGRRTSLSPYFGVGSTHVEYLSPRSLDVGPFYGGPPDQLTGRFGLEFEQFLSTSLSLGGGVAFDVRSYGGDGMQGSAALSAIGRLGFHMPFEK